MSASGPSFWHLLERAPLGGPRRHLRETYGTTLIDGLQAAGLLVESGNADWYPCPRGGGPHCPRAIVFPEDGRIEAVCGNDPAECEDIALEEDDIVVLSTDVERLYSAVAKALQIHPRVEALSGIRRTHRVGYFMPTAGVRHAVYAVNHCDSRDYAECLDALRSHAAGQSYAVLTPTDRFLSEDVMRRMASAGTPVVPLDGVLEVGATGELRRLCDPLSLFSAIGRPASAAVEPAGTEVARAYIRPRDGAAAWRALNDAAYRELVEHAAEYEVFADEIKRTSEISEGGRRRRKEKIPQSSFRLIRAALDAHGAYDPTDDDRFDQLEDARQLFQRARPHFDTHVDGDWSIFKTEMIDGRAFYRFDRDTKTSFAFIFAPSK